MGFMKVWALSDEGKAKTGVLSTDPALQGGLITRSSR